jgi:hypothetical protein
MHHRLVRHTCAGVVLLAALVLSSCGGGTSDNGTPGTPAPTPTPTPTPLPTPAPGPAPTLNFTANPSAVSANGNSTLSWSSANADSCTASGAWSGTQPATGSHTLTNLTQSGTYTLICTGAAGDISRSVIVSVASAGTRYAEKFFETQNADDVETSSPVGQLSYVPGGGFGGSNCWQLRLFGDQGNEDNVGWIGTNSAIPEGDTGTMFVGHLLYVSAGLVAKMATTHVGGKMLDVRMHEQTGDPATRQIVGWRYYDVPDLGYANTGATGVVPVLMRGGAGGTFVRQLGTRQFDLRDYADQWVWFEYEFNANERYTAVWVKTQDGAFTGARNAPLMKREADDPAHWQHQYWTEAPYDYTARGWVGAYSIWGFWDDLSGVLFTADDWVRLDNLIISNSWIDPPF